MSGTIADAIRVGDTFLGIELGSTRIKGVLTGRDHAPLATGVYTWESRLENGFWTYAEEELWSGLRQCYQDLAQDVLRRWGVTLTTMGGIGFSGMMHGYLPLDAAGALLVPFRTWRNTTTAPAAQALTRCFSFQIPQRWSIAHLEQALLNGEPHVKSICHLTTLAGYVHWRLTGQHVLGVGEASGIFPIDSITGDYDSGMAALYDDHISPRGLPWRLRDILPRVLPAGAPAGVLTEAGARLLDPTGGLRPGIPLCPPEGDAGTGMVATNAVAPRTGNVSAGTSIFAMVVLERPLSRVYPELDLVATPTGRPVAMVHCNNCTTELNAWITLFTQVIQAAGGSVDMESLFSALCQTALEGESDCGGLLVYNYHSGEPITGFDRGCPLLLRQAESRFTLPNLMRAQLNSCLATLSLGLELLLGQEEVELDRLLAHGGLFKTPQVAQRLLAGAVGVPVSVMPTASEGGAWGMALLATYACCRSEGETLEHYLEARVFAHISVSTLSPDPADRAGFAAFLHRYRQGLNLARTAADLPRGEDPIC